MIVVTWVVVILSAIPVGMSHGVVEYYNHKNEINTACLFLADDGYNHAAFQVRAGVSATQKLIITSKDDDTR